MRTFRSALISTLVIPALLSISCGCALQNYKSLRPDTKPETVAIEQTFAVPPSADPDLTNLAELPLLRLKGSGYTRGYQYGHCFSAKWQEAVKDLEDAAVRDIQPLLYFDFLSRQLYRRYTAHVFNMVDDFQDLPGSVKRMPPEYRAYVQGIADGAGLACSDITRLIATVMLSDASCSGFIAYGPATDDGRLIQLRNLDWGDPIMRPQASSILVVHEPTNGYRYLSIGFIGLVGSHPYPRCQ